MMVPIEKLFLRNQKLQRNPNSQRESPFYQVERHMKLVKNEL